MKNFSLALNGVLLVAVAILYYLYFHKENESAVSPDDLSVKSTSFDVAFVNTDTLLKYYKLSDVLSKQLETKRAKYEKEFRNRQEGLQQEIDTYQRNQPNLTIGQARSIEEELMKKQQNLQQYQQSLTDDLMREQNKINLQLYESVAEFLSNYSTDNNLKMVLTFSKGNPNLLFAHDSLDITRNVISGLNNNYEAGQNPARADSAKAK